MQLALLILSLQLALIVSGGESSRHSENDGVRRRQSSNRPQAGQLLEEGTTRVSRKRARISSTLIEIDVEEEGSGVASGQ